MKCVLLVALFIAQLPLVLSQSSASTKPKNEGSKEAKAVAAIQTAGWEIASHGFRWLDYRDFTREDELSHMREAIRIQTEMTGARPLGWYTGRVSEQTLDLVIEDGGFVYSSDSYADDLPYWVRRHDRDHLIVPYTLDANDMRFATAQGFGCGLPSPPRCARLVLTPAKRLNLKSRALKGACRFDSDPRAPGYFCVDAIACRSGRPASSNQPFSLAGRVDRPAEKNGCRGDAEGVAQGWGRFTR